VTSGQPDMDREVAGLACREVLALLPDFVDGSLSEAATDHVLQHVQVCDHCERFGGAYGHLVAAVRSALQAPGAVSESLIASVLARVAAAP